MTIKRSPVNQASTSDVSGKLTAASNLSDVASAATARTNLGVPQRLTPTASKTGNYTAVAGDLVLVDSSGGAVTVTLPAAAAGSRVGVKKTSSDTNTVTIARAGSDTIDGATSTTVVMQGSVINLDGITGGWVSSSGYKTLASLDGRYGVAPAVIIPPVVAGVPPATAAWAAANRAMFARFALPVPATLRYLNWVVGTSSGNVQVGVVSFSGSGHTSYSRVMSSGVIACPAAADIHSDLGATALPAGDYAAFIWADNTTFQTRWLSSSGLSSGRGSAIVSSLASGVPSSGTLAWGSTQVPLVTIECDI